MYVELRITAECGGKQDLVEKLRREIGVNAVAPATAVQQTIFRDHAEEVVPKVIAAEQIQHKILILYFLEGSDTIVVHMAARTVAETKQQAVRVARRVCAQFEDTSVKSKTKAVIYAVDPGGLDTAVITGERVGRWARLMGALTERWLAKLVTPAAVFVAAALLPGTSVFQSALIGLVAAAASLIIESIVLMLAGDDWKWKEVASDE